MKNLHWELLPLPYTYFYWKNIEKKEYVYGINGLADLIGCSKTHASRLKSQGIFDEAIIQRGRKIIIDREKALELFNNKL